MKSRILEKIKKLLAMVERGNPHESANAMKKIQALMAEHQLSSEDVALSGIDTASAKAANNSQKQPGWSHCLLTIIAEAFGVEAIFQWTGFPRRQMQVVFIGPAERAEIAGYVYSVLARQLLTSRREFLATLNKRMKSTTKTARADLFCEGWCQGVYGKVVALVPSEHENELVAQYKAKHFPHLVKGKVRESKATRRDEGARYDGYVSGKQVELNAGVKGQEQAKLEAL